VEVGDLMSKVRKMRVEMTRNMAEHSSLRLHKHFSITKMPVLAPHNIAVPAQQ
jgi:hypothetical protein